MKTKIYTLLTSILLCLPALAQSEQPSAPVQDVSSSAPEQISEQDKWTVGIRLGGVACDMLYTSSDYDLYKHRALARGTIGFWAERNLIAGLSIRPEFSFTGSGVRLQADDIHYGLFVRTFDIRAGLLYTFLRDKKVQPYVLFSPSLNFVMNGRVAYSDDSGKDLSVPLTKGSINPVNFSMLFGGGVRFPIEVNDFKFFINAEMGYNIGCANTFSKSELKGSVVPVNGINSKVTGKRLNSTFELALTVGIPLSNFKSKQKQPVAQQEQPEPQPVETKTVEERQEELLQQLQQEQTANKYNENMADYNAKLAPKNRVGEGIKMYVEPTVTLETADDGSQEMNLKLEFAYETIPGDMLYEKNADDYPPGKYLPEESKACMATLGFMKEQLDGELRKYFTPETRVTIRITGETDGSPVRSRIPYKGEFGDFNAEKVHVNGNPADVTVTRKTGITKNSQIGFLRAQGVRRNINTNIDALKVTQNEYQIYAVERTEKGSQYRKISVELTIHNAYANELRKVTEQPAQ